MEMYGYQFVREEDLKHYGLKGMHWGTRRWQNEDGTFNEAGYQRYFGRGTGEDYHPVKRGSTRGTPSGSGGQKKSFDKEKAKKIAKGVAIGAAVVGGTILVAYGGYKVHQAGGFANVGKDAIQKMNNIKVDTVAKAQQFKVDVAKSNADAKEKMVKLREDTKTELKKLRDESKSNIQKIKDQAALDRKINYLDPDGHFDKDVIKGLTEQYDQNGIKEKLGTLDYTERTALNSGKVKLHDLQGRRAISDYDWEHPSSSQQKYNKWIQDVVDGKADRIDRPVLNGEDFNKGRLATTDKGASKSISSVAKSAGEAAKKAYSAVTSDQAKETYKKIGETAGKAAKATGNAAKTAYKAATSDQAKATYKKIGETAGKAAKTAYKTATSDQAKANYKKAAKATGEAIKTAGHIAKSSVEITKLAAQHPQETRAAMDYTTQLLKNLGDLSATNSRNSRTVSSSNASSNYTKKQAVKEYKRQHPNTKLSDSEIASNFGF